MVQNGKRKRKAAEKHDAVYEAAASESDLMEEAKAKLLLYINSESVQKALKSVPSGKDGKKAKKQTETDVKKAQGEVDSYNRSRWGMNFAVTMVDENGTEVLCPPVFWKWHSTNESKSNSSESSSKKSEE